MSEFSKPEFRFEVRLLKMGFVKRAAGVSVSAGWMKGCSRLDEQKDTLQLLISSSVNVMAADVRRRRAAALVENVKIMDVTSLLQLLQRLLVNQRRRIFQRHLHATEPAWVISLSIFNFLFFLIIMHQNLQ